MLTKDEACPVLGGALGPGREKRTLRGQVYALPGERGELSEFAVVGEPELEAGRGDAKLVGGPKVVHHAPYCPLHPADGANDLSLNGFERESRWSIGLRSRVEVAAWG